MGMSPRTSAGPSAEHQSGTVQRRVKSYAVAAAALLLAVGLRWGLAQVLDDYAPFMFFPPAAMLATWFGGLGPGLVVLVAGLLLGDFLFLPPIWSLGPRKLVDLLEMLSYAVTTLVASGLIELVHRSRRKAQSAAEEARLRNAQLEKEIAERQRVQQALQQAKDQLASHSEELERLVARRTARLEETIASLESFSYTIAHDLRAPLRAMEGFGRALLEDYQPVLDETGLDYAQRICAASRRMDVLIQGLLQYARFATIDPAATEVAVEPVLHRVLARLALEIESTAARVELGSTWLPVRANPALLEEVLYQLLSNALKFVRNDVQPAVRVWTEQRPDAVRVCVQDNGIGIDPEYHAKIFGPFGRLHGPEAYPGVGIGLPIVKRAADRMGGKVGVESAPAPGSTFWLELPRP